MKGFREESVAIRLPSAVETIPEGGDLFYDIPPKGYGVVGLCQRLFAGRLSDYELDLAGLSYQHEQHANYGSGFMNWQQEFAVLARYNGAVVPMIPFYWECGQLVNPVGTDAMFSIGANGDLIPEEALSERDMAVFASYPLRKMIVRDEQGRITGVMLYWADASENGYERAKRYMRLYAGKLPEIIGSIRQKQRG